MAMALGALSVALAVAVAALAFEALRRQQRLAAQRNLLVQARADELEQFAGRVAHDIKSPLGAVGLALHLAQKGTTDPQRLQSVVTRALSSVHRVQHTVDELLAFAKAGAHPEAGAATSLSAVVDEVVDELRPLAEERQVALAVQRVGEAGPWVACAPGALSSLVSNLLRNAVKYTADSRVRRVQVRVLDRGRCGRLEVDDTGPGIPADLQQQIFKAYVRAPGADGPGIGLGLAIVKRLAEAHGGVVGVRSTVGNGSCFWFEIPKAAPQPQVGARAAVGD
jgi:signal transduction histidine kinase